MWHNFIIQLPQNPKNQTQTDFNAKCHIKLLVVQSVCSVGMGPILHCVTFLPGNSLVIPVLGSAEQVPKYLWLPLDCFGMPFRGINPERGTEPLLKTELWQTDHENRWLLNGVWRGTDNAFHCRKLFGFLDIFYI